MLRVRPNGVAGGGGGPALAVRPSGHELAVVLETGGGKVQHFGLALAHGVAAAPVQQHTAFGLLGHLVFFNGVGCGGQLWGRFCGFFGWGQQHQAGTHGLTRRNRLCGLCASGLALGVHSQVKPAPGHHAARLAKTRSSCAAACLPSEEAAQPTQCAHVRHVVHASHGHSRHVHPILRDRRFDHLRLRPSRATAQHGQCRGGQGIVVSMGKGLTG
jgi:hypothetical protein